MDPPVPVPLEQLPLPLMPVPTKPDRPAGPVLAPAHVWPTLPPPLQDTCRRTFVYILQEVIDNACCHRENYPTPS
jgi:hypothetical protein